MIKFSTVVFDLDGTLIDSSRNITNAVNNTRKHYNLAPLSVHQVIGYVGSGVRQLIEQALFSGNNYNVEEAREIFLQFYGDHLLEETTVYPGIYALLEELDGDYNLAIATNKPLELSRTTIKGLGMERAFKIITAPETTGMAKPAAGMLEHIATRFRSTPKEIIMVGDSPVDIETAKNFGCASCAVTWGYNIPDVLHKSKPDYVIHEPLDLLSYL